MLPDTRSPLKNKWLVKTQYYYLKGGFTSWNLPVVEAGVTHSYRSEAPPPLRHRPGFGGAGITETFSAGTTVVLGVVGLELLAAFVAFLQFFKRAFSLNRH